MRNERVKFDAAGRPLEAVLLGDRQHAGLVRVIGYAVLSGGWLCPQLSKAAAEAYQLS